MPKRVVAAAAIAVLAALVGCPGDFPPSRDGANTPIPDSTIDQGTLFDITSPTFDTSPADGPAADGPRGDGPSPDSALTCSPTGVPSNCDARDGSGCGASATCYVINGKGPSCVCPAGAAAEGAACTTTVDCQAGHACAGDSPPGVCRKVCVPPPGIDTCTGGRKCAPFKPYPQLGACI